MANDDTDQVRLKILEGLKNGDLPRYPLTPGAVPLSAGTVPKEFMVAGLLQGPCSGCGRSGDHGTIYSVDAGTFRFPLECHRLWVEESERVTLR
jgi:hypothetical protein